MTKLNIILWVATIASCMLIIQNRYDYRKLNNDLAQIQQENTKLQQEKAELEYQYNLYANPKFISEQAAKQHLIEPKSTQTIYVDIQP